MSCDSTSDSGLDDDEDEPMFKRKNPSSHKNRAFRLKAKPPIYRTQVPFENLGEALKILNTPMKTVYNPCIAKQQARIPMQHKIITHYSKLLKMTIMRRDWRNIPKLLIAYINTPKRELVHSKVILRYAFIFLLNDPVAKKNEFLLEFFNTLLFSRTKEEQLDFLKKLMTIPGLESKYLKIQTK